MSYSFSESLLEWTGGWLIRHKFVGMGENVWVLKVTVFASFQVAGK
jgi:hypothetical protein